MMWKPFLRTNEILIGFAGPRVIEQTIGHINGRFADVGWTPVQFYFRGFPFEEVVAWYAMADVMWITPLRDGLNLVAKEFAATQGLTQGCGVLVLSEFAGAAVELGAAVLTNPFSTRQECVLLSVFSFLFVKFQHSAQPLQVKVSNGIGTQDVSA